MGEKSTPNHIDAFSKAKKTKHDIGIVVNDIDFSRKLTFYKQFGKESVIRLYGNRIKCGTTVPLCKLPDFSKIKDIIDWKAYDRAIKIWDKSGKGLSEILNEEIINPLVEERLNEYGTSMKTSHVFREKQLRNRAGVKLRASAQTKGSWREELTKTKILDKVLTHQGNTPMCGGILLALYEELANEGYEKVIQIYEKDEKPAVENGITLYQKLHRQFPKDPRWKLTFENQYW